MNLSKLDSNKLFENNKYMIFNKLVSISEKEDFHSWKDNNYKKLLDYYKISLLQLKDNNSIFLNKFNLLYSSSRYNELIEYINTFKSKSLPKKNSKPKN